MRHVSRLPLLGGIMLLFVASAVGQTATPIIPANTHEGQQFGSVAASVSDSLRLIVGASKEKVGFSLDAGAAYVFKYDNGNWTEAARLQSPNPGNFDQFGYSVAISGLVVMASAFNDKNYAANGGAVYVWRHNGLQWIYETALVPGDIDRNYRFGGQIDLDGNVAIISGQGADVAGAAYVFEYAGGSWIERQKLIPPNGKGGDVYGSAVAIKGNHLIVGDLASDDGNGNVSGGAAFVYRNESGVWIEEAKLATSDSLSFTNFAHSVDIDGQWSVVGESIWGAAYVYHYDGQSWSFHSKLIPSDSTAFGGFGTSVTIEGAKIMVGSPRWAAPGEDAAGKTYLYEYDLITDQWLPENFMTPDDGGTNDKFGEFVDLEGGFAFAGAPNHHTFEDRGGVFFKLDKAGVVYAYQIGALNTSIDDVPDDSQPNGQGELLSSPFPNPTFGSSLIHLSPLTTGRVRVELFDVTGRRRSVLFDETLAGLSRTELPIAMNHLSAGLYFVRVTSRDGVQTRRIVKTN